ncbi:hypothetical protein [Maridesulfovibrio sp.]
MSITTRHIFKDLSLKRKLGTGVHGTTYLAENDQGSLFVLKILHEDVSLR